MFTNIRYILLTALRDKLFAGLMLGVLVATYLSRVLGSTAMVEDLEMSLTFAGASSRLIVVIGLIVFVCFHIRHAFESKEIDVFLTRPITRANLVLSYFLGFCVVATLLVIPLALLLGITGVMQWDGFIAWTVSIVLETWLVVAIALFAAVTLKSAVASVMASLGFYVLSRMMGFFLITSESAFLFREHWLNAVISYTLKSIAILVPRLDFYAKTEWLVYGIKQPEVIWFVGQSAVFIPLLLVATMMDFRRKQF